MDKYKTERGKLVKHHGILIDVREDGSVHIQISHASHAPGQALDLTEDEVSHLYGLLGDVTHWDQLTSNRAEKLADHVEAEEIS